MLYCNQYEKMREDLFKKVEIPDFLELTDHLKMKYLLTCKNIARAVGQYIVDAFDKRPIK